MVAQNILPEPLIFELNFATGGYSHDVNEQKICFSTNIKNRSKNDDNIKIKIILS